MEENLMCPICGGLHPAGHRDKELEDKLEAIKNKVSEWESIYMRDRHAAPSILNDLEKLLEAED